MIDEPVEKVGFRSISGVKSGSEVSKIVPLALKRGAEAGAGEFFNSLKSSRKSIFIELDKTVLRRLSKALQAFPTQTAEHYV